MVLLGFFGGYEILIIAGVVLLLFGGKKVPELMRGMGKGIREFKDATSMDEVKKEVDGMRSEMHDASSEIHNTDNQSNKSGRPKRK